MPRSRRLQAHSSAMKLPPTTSARPAASAAARIAVMSARARSDEDPASPAPGTSAGAAGRRSRPARGRSEQPAVGELTIRSRGRAARCRVPSQSSMPWSRQNASGRSASGLGSAAPCIISLVSSVRSYGGPGPRRAARCARGSPLRAARAPRSPRRRPRRRSRTRAGRRRIDNMRRRGAGPARQREQDAAGVDRLGNAPARRARAAPAPRRCAHESRHGATGQTIRSPASTPSARGAP